jgi:hypothetical protein
MPRGRHVTLSASTLAPARLERPARSAEAAAMRSQIAEASKRLPPELVGPDGNPATRDEAAAAFLRWAGDDPAKLRRALARVLELAAPRAVAARHAPSGPSRPPAPRPRRQPRPSAWDPDPSRRAR